MLGEMSNITTKDFSVTSVCFVSYRQQILIKHCKMEVTQSSRDIRSGGHWYTGPRSHGYVVQCTARLSLAMLERDCARSLS